MHSILVLALATSALVLPVVDAAAASATVQGAGYSMTVAAPEGSQDSQESQEPVDVNTATEKVLEKIPGIGPAMAQRIIAWRKEHGPFERVEDLLNVRGIGVKTLEKLRPFVVVHEDTAVRGR